MEASVIEGVKLVYSDAFRFVGDLDEYEPYVDEKEVAFRHLATACVFGIEDGMITSVVFGGIEADMEFSDFLELLELTKGDALLEVIRDAGSKVELLAVEDGKLTMCALEQVLDCLAGDVIYTMGVFGEVL